MYATERVNESKFKDVAHILKKISDDRALILFNGIALSNGERYMSLKEMNLTTKQYYSRISGLLSVGLIRRDKGKYSLTLLGKVLYDSQMTIGKTLAYYWKLKAIDSMEMSASAANNFPEGERVQLINALIDNHHIKDILMKTVSVSVSSSERRTTVSERTPPIEQKITI